ncbi:YciI family protein [Devosia sp. ZB163]|uniref:YciI family protein n=1 Tax=Devosia sp. ZB163 TaxID=3025938 RepID=UPI002362FA48|nr:YciI family protein [Devosia sp. ZB163]MDC9824543.1 YciI family protein [Devosia sp. ZB163]
MRFMIIVKATPESEAGIMPKPEVFEAMGKFNEELINAGVLLAGEGLHPSSEGALVTSSGGEITVTDGPFAESKELIAGFWIITAKSKDEALEWVKRIPFDDGETIELRRVFEAADFAEVLSADEIAKEQAWRDANQKPITN